MYLVDFQDQPPSETSWVPLSDIPAIYNERIEQFHRRNPNRPRPADSTLFRSRPISHSKTPHAPIAPIHDPSSTSLPTSAPLQSPQIPENIPNPPSSSVPIPFPFSSSTHLHPPPDPKPPSLRTTYTPPHQTTTRSGRFSPCRPRCNYTCGYGQFPLVPDLKEEVVLRRCTTNLVPISILGNNPHVPTSRSPTM